jgi:hypothetical protein
MRRNRLAALVEAVLVPSSTLCALLFLNTRLGMVMFKIDRRFQEIH